MFFVHVHQQIVPIRAGYDAVNVIGGANRAECTTGTGGNDGAVIGAETFQIAHRGAHAAAVFFDAIKNNHVPRGVGQDQFEFILFLQPLQRYAIEHDRHRLALDVKLGARACCSHHRRHQRRCREGAVHHGATDERH